MYSRKDTSPNHTEFLKNQKTCLFPLILQGEIYFEHCFQLFKKTELGQLEKSQQVYHCEKEGERISAIRNTVYHYTENPGLERIFEAKSGNESTMDQELDICYKVFEVSAYEMRRVCVTIKKYSVKKPLYFHNRLFIAK